MRISDRYILRELLGPFLLGVGGFIVILTGDILYALTEFLASRRITLDMVARLLAYKLPAIIVITFPVSTLFGTLLGLGRLAQHRELQAMRLTGASLGRIFAPVLAFGLLMAGFTFLTNEFFAPWANHQANTLIRGAAFGEAFPHIRAQVFFRGPGNRFFYIEQVDDKRRTLRNVMIYEMAGSLPRLITASAATWDDQVWHLADGVLRELDEIGFTRYETGFATMDISVDLEEGAFFSGQKTPDEMTARELRTYLRLFEQGDASRRFAVEWHRKFAIPLASAAFALVAAPLSLFAVQGGRFLGIGMSIFLLFVYYVMMSVGRAVGAAGGAPPALAAWLPNLIFVAGGAFLWAHQDGWLWRRPRQPRALAVGTTP